MANNYFKLNRFISLIGDLLLLNLAFILSYEIRLMNELGVLLTTPYILLLLFFDILWLFISIIVINRTSMDFTNYTSTSKQLIKSIFFHLFIVTTIFSLSRTIFFSRLHFGLTYVLFGVLLFIWRFLLIRFTRQYQQKSNNQQKFVIAGYDQLGSDLVKYYEQNPQLGYLFQGFFDDKINNSQTLGKLTDLKNYVLSNQIDVIYCTLPILEKRFIRFISKFADQNLIRVKLLFDLKGFVSTNTQIEIYNNLPIVSTRPEPLNDALNLFFKRAFDIVFSLLVIIFILSWMLPLIALLIRLDSKGSIFFFQKRSGKLGNTFWCLKFRTMEANQDSDTKQASRNDKRITRVGRILRKTNLDELPQFFNVLVGNMSIVGPRPHMIYHTEQYSHLINKYMVRHLVKPGITGLAQVKGFRGETSTIKAMLDRIRLDIFYVENWSFLLDVKIIFLTIFNLMEGNKNAF